MNINCLFTRPTNSRHALVAAAVALLAACATTAPPHQAARIEVQEEVGFTITEEARVSNDVRVEYDQALTLLQQGNLQSGIAQLRNVVVSAPNLAAPRVDLGIALHRKGDLEAAAGELSAALESNPDHPIAHNEIGIVYRKLGRFDEARSHYESALAVYPSYHFARRNLAVLCDLYLADLDCAIRNYEAYAVTVPNDEEVTMWIADLRNRQERRQR